MILRFAIFPSVDALVAFVNENKIPRENVAAILENWTLLYWE